MAIDWTKSMRQTYEVYTVDPTSWLNNRLLDTVTGASITRDISSDTVVSGSIDYVGELDEEYVRIYLIAEQDGEVERVPLITMLCQTPSTEYNGKYTKTSITGYSPLLELEGEYPAIGYTLPHNYPSWYYPSYRYGNKGVITDLTAIIPDIVTSYCRAPVGHMPDVTEASINALSENYTVDLEKNWKEVIFELLEKVGCKVMVDPMGEISFYKQPIITQLNPVWTFDDSNSSILSSDVSIERDLYNVPNVVELIVSTVAGRILTATAENNNENSPISIQNRGRRVVYREINPTNLGNISTDITQDTLQEWAEQILEQKSSLAYTVSYTHGYCPAHVGDCVLINHEAAGINAERAYIMSQKIDCKTGCQVEETALFTRSLYRRS